MSSEIVFVLFCIEECSSYMLVRNKVYVVLITGLEYYIGDEEKFLATVGERYFESFINTERSFGDRHVIEQRQHVER